MLSELVQFTLQAPTTTPATLPAPEPLGPVGPWQSSFSLDFWFFYAAAAVSLIVLVGLVWRFMIKDRSDREVHVDGPVHHRAWFSVIVLVVLGLLWLGSVHLLPELLWRPEEGTAQRVPPIYSVMTALGVGFVGAAFIGGVIGVVQNFIEDQRIKSEQALEDRRIEEARALEDQRIKSEQALEDRRIEEARAFEKRQRDADDRQALRTMLSSGTEFPYIDLSGKDLSHLYLVRRNLEGANLEGADLERANLREANLSGASLVRASLGSVWFIGANLREANLRGASLFCTWLVGANLEGANLKGAEDLCTAVFREAKLPGASLAGMNLRTVDLEGADLNGADLQEADLSEADLTEANLEGTNLRYATLERVHLEGANLEGANLFYVSLEKAYLQGANLERANLQGANLEGAYLEGANLQGANLQGAYLEGAKLEGASFEGALWTPTYLPPDDPDEDVLGPTVWPDGFDPSSPEYGLIRVI